MYPRIVVPNIGYKSAIFSRIPNHTVNVEVGRKSGNTVHIRGLPQDHHLMMSDVLAKKYFGITS